MLLIVEINQLKQKIHGVDLIIYEKELIFIYYECFLSYFAINININIKFNSILYKIKQKTRMERNLSRSRKKAAQHVKNINSIMYDSIEDGSLLVVDNQKKTQNIISKVNKKIFDLIDEGQLEINRKQTEYPISDHTNQYLLGINLSINLLNQNLRQYSESLLQEKEEQKQHHKKKQLEAKQFVKKMQKEKQQFKQKIKHKKSQSRLFVRAYSEDTIRIMNEKLQNRIAEKKRDLQQKIINIKKRTINRVETLANKEIQYWDKVKNIQSSRSMSTDRLLPVLHSRNNQSNLIQINPQKSYQSNQSNSNRYESKFSHVDKNLMKVKLKLKNFQQNYKSTEVQSLNRIERMIQKNRQLQLKIDSSNKNNALALKYSNNRYKIIGNQYLKQSIKKIVPYNAQKQILKSSKAQSQEPQLQVNASYLKPMQNPYKSSLATSWQDTLMKIQAHQIPKLRGLDLLSSIEKKLNKFDPNGITVRLRQKVKVIDNIDGKASASNNSTIFNNFQEQNTINQLILSSYKNNTEQSQAVSHSNEFI